MAGKTFIERKNIDAVMFKVSPTANPVTAGDIVVVGDLVGVVQQTTKDKDEQVTLYTAPCICQAAIPSGTVGAKVIFAPATGALSIGTTGTQIGVVVEVIDASTVAFYKFEVAKAA